MTNDDERAAREWLQNKANYSPHPHAQTCRTILALIDRPVLPRGEDVPDDVLCKMMQGFWDSPGGYQGGLRAAIDILHAHLTAPPPAKRIELYAVVSPTGDVISVYDKDDGIEPRVRNGGRVVKLMEAVDE